jgi:hypothetical protein
MTTNNILNDSTDNAADARIDAMARSAGSQYRRPAPTQGIARVQRARRTQQVSRAVMGTTAALAFVAVGVLAVNRRNANEAPAVATIGNTEPQASAPLNVASSVPPPTPSATAAPSVAPVDSTATAPADPVATNGAGPAGSPSVVYVSKEGPFSTEQDLVDPVTGQVIGTESTDFDKSRAAQVALGLDYIGADGAPYFFRPVVDEDGTFTPEDFPDSDRCRQNVVTRPAGSTIPERVSSLYVSSDGRRVVTVSAVCPEPGTLVADGDTALQFESILQVFDGENPTAPGRMLATPQPTDGLYSPSFSGDGRFFSTGTDIYDLDSTAKVDLGLECPEFGFFPLSRWAGPWVGDSSIALSLDCGSAGAKLVVRDLLAPGGDLEVAIPPAAFEGLTLEIDHVHYTTPGDAWFTICGGGATPNCWVGHGNNPLVEIPGVREASFITLGYYPGG